MSRATRRALILIPILLLVLAVLFFVLRPASETTEVPQEKTVDLAIRQDTMTPDQITVNEGDQVRLRITSDRALEFHLHGYDLSKEVEPGEPAELAFDANTTGRFEIEDEQAHRELGVLIVQPR